MKILITGSKGQLGIELIDIAPQEHKIFGYDLDMDITDRFAIESRFSKVKPDLVIHCAAFTDVDKCEDRRKKAFLVNSTGTENLAKVARKEVNTAKTSSNSSLRTLALRTKTISDKITTPATKLPCRLLHNTKNTGVTNRHFFQNFFVSTT